MIWHAIEFLFTILLTMICASKLLNELIWALANDPTTWSVRVCQSILKVNNGTFSSRFTALTMAWMWFEIIRRVWIAPR